MKYTQRSGAGVITYRRVIPESLRDVVGKREFKRKLGETLLEATRNYDLVAKEFDILIAEASTSQNRAELEKRRSELANITEFQIAHRAERDFKSIQREYIVLDGERVPLTDGDAASLYADLLQEATETSAEGRRETANSPAYLREQMLVQALRGRPIKAKATIKDAYRIYKELRVDGSTAEKANTQRLDRVMEYMATVFSFDTPIEDVKRADARAVLDHMLYDKGQNPTTARRYLNVIKAMLSLAIKEFDLTSVNNPFSQLEIKGEAAAIEQRKPFSNAQIIAIAERLKTHAFTPDLHSIWVLLAGTGARLAEITGLLAEDVVIREDGVSYLDIRFHEHRRLKNKASVRWVPLTGASLTVAKALKARAQASGETFTFPRYAKDRGPDLASKSLMQHVREITDDKRLSNHSLRHAMEDRLSRAGVDEFDRNLVLGHSKGGMSERYGGREARLDAAAKAVQKVELSGL